MLPWIIAAIAIVAAAVLGWQLTRARTVAREAQQRQIRQERDLRDELAKANELRENLLQVVDDALLVLDAGQTIVYANPSAEALFEGDLVGGTLMSTVRQPEFETLIDDAQRLHGETVERRVELDRHVLHARAVASNSGRTAYDVLSLRDVTELQRLERARREMVSNITHELSTPITSIGLLADTLSGLAARGKTKRVRKMVRDIRRETDTLTHLVQEIRDLSRIESGQMPIRMTPNKLATIVRDAVEPLMPLMENRRQTISLTVDENIQVLADEVQIQRALKNILHNAIKFTPETGEIRVSATTAEHEAIVAIADNGPGIPDEDLPRIFERFFQVDRSRREGTGLGLAIVRHIVNAHGGRTWAESVQGEGATFFVTLALADEPTEGQALQSTPASEESEGP